MNRVPSEGCADRTVVFTGEEAQALRRYARAQGRPTAAGSALGPIVRMVLAAVVGELAETGSAGADAGAQGGGEVGAPSLGRIRAAFDEAALERLGEFYAATPRDALAEALQNARRAGASTVRVTFTVPREGVRPTVAIRDDGSGVADPAVLLSFGTSAWPGQIARDEHSAGMGILSYAAWPVQIASICEGAGGEGFEVALAREHFEGRVPAPLRPWAGDGRGAGCEVRLELADVAEAERFAEALGELARFFPLPVECTLELALDLGDAARDALRAGGLKEGERRRLDPEGDPFRALAEACGLFGLRVGTWAALLTVWHCTLGATGAPTTLVASGPLARERFLARCDHVERVLGVDIGVERCCVETLAERGPDLSFHGQLVRARLCAVVDRSGLAWIARADVVGAPGLELVLPARRAVIENAFLDDLRAAAQGVVDRAIAATTLAMARETRSVLVWMPGHEAVPVLLAHADAVRSGVAPPALYLHRRGAATRVRQSEALALESRLSRIERSDEDAALRETLVRAAERLRGGGPPQAVGPGALLMARATTRALDATVDWAFAPAGDPRASAGGDEGEVPPLYDPDAWAEGDATYDALPRVRSVDVRIDPAEPVYDWHGNLHLARVRSIEVTLFDGGGRALATRPSAVAFFGLGYSGDQPMRVAVADPHCAIGLVAEDIVEMTLDDMGWVDHWAGESRPSWVDQCSYGQLRPWALDATRAALSRLCGSVRAALREDVLEFAAKRVQRNLPPHLHMVADIGPERACVAYRRVAEPRRSRP